MSQARVTMKEMNKAIFLASEHLYEAGRELAMIEQFRPTGLQLLNMSRELVSIAKPQLQKVDNAKMKSILGEILKD